MKLLVLPSNYPSPAHPLAATFNERSVATLTRLCEKVEVLAPRPYAPPFVSRLNRRWRAYARIPSFEVRNGVSVYRPAYLQLPRLAQGYWIDAGAFFWCRSLAMKLHQRTRFDAILSFDLLGAGGVAWRIGRYLGIPAVGWATGGEVRTSGSSSNNRVVIQALKSLDLVFYQSQELFSLAAGLLSIRTDRMPKHRHVVLSRGISVPPSLPRDEVRAQIRAELRISDDEVLIMSIGRIHREKGIFELIDAASLALVRNPSIRLVLIGSDPAFDDTVSVQKRIKDTPGIGQKVKLLPACSPERVWEYLCAADVFAFTSYREGMPNSLLEAMAMGVPSVAFAIPPVLEIESGTGAIVLVPPFDPARFEQALRPLVNSPADRARIGAIGRKQVFDRFMVGKNMASVMTEIEHLVGDWSRSPTPYLQVIKSQEIQTPSALNNR